MEIDEILKQATSYKKTNGQSFAIDYLISCYSEIKTEDLKRWFDKIFTYFSKDKTNQKLIDFILELIRLEKIEQYSELLTGYYWILKDYESYKLTLMNEIGKVNPNNPWQYCFDLKRIENSLCNYYRVKGLDKRENAIEYLFHFLMATYYDVAEELMQFDFNFKHYHSYIRYGNELKFHYPDRLIHLGESIESWFEDDTDDENRCLRTLNCLMPKEQILRLIKEKIFYDFPKHLGFNNDILNEEYNDTSSFVLSFFPKNNFDDILALNEKINEWKIQIAGKTVVYGSEETNNILKTLIN